MIEKKKKIIENEEILLSAKKMEKIAKLISSCQNNLDELKNILFLEKYKNKISDIDTKEAKEYTEGVFDGQKMIDKNGKQYDVPENYASKSKLIAGDKLKLVVSPQGFFVFKQISPIERTRAIGILKKIGDNFQVEVEDRKYNVLKASVTYFKAKHGDQLTILIPEKDHDVLWAAIENKIK